MAKPGSVKIPINFHPAEKLLWRGEQPTRLQRLWGNVFLSLWYLADMEGAGAGKTWFWKHIVDFIELQDPEVHPR